MSDPVTDAIVTAVNLEAGKRGMTLPVEQAVEVVRAVALFITGKLDESAHREAERAGAERAAKVTDMESAEKAAKERK